MKKQWIGPPEIPDSVVDSLVHGLGVPSIVARILASRGRTDLDCARAFLHPELSSLASPHLLLGLDRTLERLRRAILSREKILIFGDFDVDGVTGTCLALRVLQRVGANADFLLPHRIEHGYGLSFKVLPEILKREPGVVLTVDCAIRSVDEIAALQEHGIDVLLTDHHEPGPVLPPAYAVIDPKQEGCPYPDKRLAAVGVMYQILRGLLSDLEHEVDLESELDLVALGTVADVVPLDGENRVFVSHGLRVMNERAKIGIMKLAEAAGVNGELEAWHLAYLLGPRINAAGRLGDASVAVRLLNAADTNTASELARVLDDANRERQELSHSTLQQANEAIDRGTAGDNPSGIVLASNQWHPGVIGIATAKLVDRFHRPAVLIAMNGDRGRGSVRSISGIDICAVLDECGDLLVQHGGHEMAAGLTIERDRVQDFRERFSKGVAARLTAENSVSKLKIDCAITPEDVDATLLASLEVLSPFGFGNSRPNFLLRGAEISSAPKVVGRGHLKLQLRRRHGMGPLECIGFDLADLMPRNGRGRLVDLVGHVAVNEWNGRRVPQLQIADVRFEEEGAAAPASPPAIAEKSP